MAIQVNNLVGMVAQMKAAGVNLISANGQIVDFGNGVHNIFVEDPNGMNLECLNAPRHRREAQSSRVSFRPSRRCADGLPDIRR